MYNPFSHHEHSETDAFRARFVGARTPRLSPEAKTRMKAALLSEFNRVIPIDDTRYRYRETKRKSLSFQPMMIPIIAAIVILLGGSVGTVVASDAAKPGDALFGIDQAAENVRLALSFSDTTKAEVKAEIAEEREQERIDLESEGRSDDALLAEEHADSALENAIETISRVRLKMQEKGNTEAEQALAEVEAKLTNLRQLRDAREDNQDEQTGLAEVEVRLQNNTAQVKLEFNGEKETFVLSTIDQTEIIQEVVDRTGATIAEVQAVIHFETEDDTNANENENGNTNSDDENENDNENENVNADDSEDDQGQEQEQEQESNRNANVNRNANANRNANENENRNTNSSGEQEENQGTEIRVEVKLEDGTAEIKTKVGGREQEWELNTTNQNTILLSISAKTGLAASAIEALWQYRVED